MEVGDGLAAVLAGVGYEAEALGEVAFAQVGSGFEDVAEEFGGGLGGIGEVPLGDDEEVGGGLRIDVGEDEG